MIVEFLKKNIVIVCIVAVLMVIMIMIIISIQESYSYTLVSDKSGNLATQANLPIGVIIMWSGSTSGLPYGWVLCDGSTYPVGSTGTITTPDLRSKFIVGASNANNGPGGLTIYNVGSVGGEETHTLSQGEMPLHSHFVNSISPGGTLPGFAYHNDNQLVSEGSISESAGSNLPHENRPPYYALAFIMKIQ